MASKYLFPVFFAVFQSMVLLPAAVVFEYPAYAGAKASLAAAPAPQDAEDQQLLTEARRFVDKNSTPGIKYKLKIGKKTGRWAMIEVVPAGDSEGAGVLMEKVDGRWIAREMGTDFSGWEAKAPELFR